jgi:hypothetical protein
MHARREAAVRSAQVNREKFSEAEKVLPVAQTSDGVKAPTKHFGPDVQGEKP